MSTLRHSLRHKGTCTSTRVVLTRSYATVPAVLVESTDLLVRTCTCTTTCTSSTVVRLPSGDMEERRALAVCGGVCIAVATAVLLSSAWGTTEESSHRRGKVEFSAVKEGCSEAGEVGFQTPVGKCPRCALVKISSDSREGTRPYNKIPTRLPPALQLYI